MDQGQSRIHELERLRKRARLSYGIYGAGLLIAVIMAFISNILWALVIGVLTVLLNILICARDIKEYRRRFRSKKLLEMTRGLFRWTELAEKNLFSAKQAEEDGMLPGNASRGVVRIGMHGESFRGVKAEIADIAFPVPAERADGKASHLILSGCYMHFLLKRDTGMHMVCFRKDLSVSRIFCRYYEEQGLERTEWGNFLFYGKTCEKTGLRNPGTAFMERLLKVDEASGGKAVVMFRGNTAAVFSCGRFLEPGEPDYKHPVMEGKLKEKYLPELAYAVRLMDDCSSPR